MIFLKKKLKASLEACLIRQHFRANYFFLKNGKSYFKFEENFSDSCAKFEERLGLNERHPSCDIELYGNCYVAANRILLQRKSFLVLECKIQSETVNQKCTCNCTAQ